MNDIGIIGLGTMGRNLAYNASRSLKVSVNTRSEDTLAEFKDNLKTDSKIKIKLSCEEFKCKNKNCELKIHEVFQANEKNVFCYSNLDEFLESLKGPRIILLLIPSFAVTKFLENLKENKLLKTEDVIVDCGNTYYKDSVANSTILDCRYTCIGTSGGAIGALKGPAMMVGIGQKENFSKIVEAKILAEKNIFFDAESFKKTKKIKKNESDNFSLDSVKKLFNDLNKISPCVTIVGPNYFGHYVKMVHNGIEYAIMSLLAEVSTALILKVGIQHTIQIFRKINLRCKLFLINCLLKVLEKKCENICNEKNCTKNILVHLESVTGQKGTGKWCVKEAIDLNIDLGMISSSVFERIRTKDCLVERKFSSSKNIVKTEIENNKCILCNSFLSEKSEDCHIHISLLDFHDSILQLVILSYYEGICLLKARYEAEGVVFSPKSIIKSWRTNCIIESRILNHLIFSSDSDLGNEESDKYRFLKRTMQNYSNSTKTGINTDGFSGLSIIMTDVSATTYFCGLSNFQLHKSNVGKIMQGIRDVFGEHGVLVNGKEMNVRWGK